MVPASCDLGGPADARLFASLAKRADVLHYQFPWPFADLLHLLVRPEVPAVLTYHSDIIRQRWLGAIYAPLMWRMLRSVQVIVATSPNYAQSSPVLSHPSIRDKVRVIPLGIDEQTYPAEGDESILQKLELEDGQPYFLFIGVLRYYKGLHTLIEAATRIKAKIVIAGSGPERERLVKQAQELGAVNVVFAGQVSNREKVSLLKKCAALVLPSHLRSEAFGMVLVEAAMFGRPLISCEMGSGTTFVNAHEETGFAVPPESPQALAQAMQFLLEEGLANKMGLAARQRYERLFSGNALGQAYAALYKDVLSHG